MCPDAHLPPVPARNTTSRTEIYTLSLHDALPISGTRTVSVGWLNRIARALGVEAGDLDRKSTRLNSSHRCISYAVFCLKKTNPPGAERESTPRLKIADGSIDNIYPCRIDRETKLH